jgi:hypothetical protein
MLTVQQDGDTADVITAIPPTRSEGKMKSSHRTLRYHAERFTRDEIKDEMRGNNDVYGWNSRKIAVRYTEARY